MKVLLSSVFAPYGVDDRYGRKENRMELFHNQITREQGLFSLRFHHQSFGLYLIAENIEAPTKVLDFPTEEDFVREIRRGYDIVGISFIVPNFEKARRMARLVRMHAPGSKIALGGHGTSIPGVEGMIEHDYICRGEGVRWFRRLLGENPARPLRHPVMPAGFQKRVMGVPLHTESAVLIPGVGCPNACRFCATSHFFGREYTPYFDTGRELFDICRDIESKRGFKEFFIMDENFLKRPQRARELLELMESNGKPYRFSIFSSAETIREIGVEFLARLGVHFVWIGVESQRVEFDKNRGIDMKGMIRDLRGWGISTLASGILFLEHHDAATIWEDIRYIVGLESDFVQFMQLGPIPGTRLYEDYDAKGLLLDDVPFEEQHGQHRIWFRHPQFTPEESDRVLKAAFRHDYDVQGSWLLRRCETVIRGIGRLSGPVDPFMAMRKRALEADASMLRRVFGAMRRFAHNPAVLRKTIRVQGEYGRILGPPDLKERAANFITYFAALREKLAVESGRIISQPRTFSRKYRMSARDLVAGYLRGKSLSSLLKLDIQWGDKSVVLNVKGTLDRVNGRKLSKKIRSYVRSNGSAIELVFDSLADFDEKALRRLLKRVSRFRDQVRIRMTECAERAMEIVRSLPAEMIQG